MRSALLLACLLPALVACHDDDDGGGGGIPVYTELEPNDAPADANHLGVIHPGDRFFIEGFVRDDAADPFDGFAFTAGQPLHVDFQLFMPSTAVDLDVCLYDPQLDQTLACYATDQQPERGGVDVDTGGLDFHLVVESFIGDSNYSLEIVVLPFFLREALGEGAPSIRASGAGAAHATDAPRDYRDRRDAREPVTVLEQVIELDPETGIVLSIVRASSL